MGRISVGHYTKASFNLGYDIREDGDQRIVSFRGDGLPWSAWIIFPIVFLIMLGLLTTKFWIEPIVIISVTGFLTCLTFQRQEFALTPTRIVNGGTEYEASRISGILIDNPLNKNVSVISSPGMIFGGPDIASASSAVTANMVGAATHTMAHMFVANARAAAKRRFRVRIRYGSKVIPPARNLKENHAVSIF